jgi:hypothetical protein
VLTTQSRRTAYTPSDPTTMSRFFPHASYAEDQPLSHTILTTHVLYRGFQTGAVLSPLFYGARALLRRRSNAPLPSFVRFTGRTALITTALMIPGLASRMWGREEIEWKDRSWRLLENEGQMETDDFSLVGTAVGVLVAAARRPVGGRGGVLRVAGGAGIGNVVGVVAYMGWRYGVNRGKFPERSVVT